MGEYDDLPYIVIERKSGGVAPFLWGALLGAGAALLLAPRSGEETQREIREGALRVRDLATGRISDAVDQTRQEVRSRVDALRDAVDARVMQARQAVDAGRQAAQSARHELEERIAEAKADMAGDRRPGRAAPRADVVVTEVIVEEGPENEIG